MSGTHETPTWRLAGFPLEGFFVFVVALGAGFFALDLLLTAGIAIWGAVESSVWERATQLVRVFVAVMAVWLVFAYLAIYVAHGVTRREFMTKAVVFVVALAAVLAALVALGFVLERVLFDVADWRHDLTDDHLFTSPRQVASVVLAYWLVYVVWGAVGLFVAAGFYRDEGAWGLVALPVGILLLVPVELAVGSSGVPFLGRALEIEAGRPVLAVVLCLLASVVGLASAWLLVRDMPIRSQRV